MKKRQVQGPVSTDTGPWKRDRYRALYLWNERFMYKKNAISTCEAVWNWWCHVKRGVATALFLRKEPCIYQKQQYISTKQAVKYRPRNVKRNVKRVLYLWKEPYICGKDFKRPYIYERDFQKDLHRRNRRCNTDHAMSKEMSKESCICEKSPMSTKEISKDPIFAKEISKETYIYETGDVILTTQCQKRCQKSLKSVKRALYLRKRFQKSPISTERETPN